LERRYISTVILSTKINFKRGKNGLPQILLRTREQFQDLSRSFSSRDIKNAKKDVRERPESAGAEKSRLSPRKDLDET